MNSPTVAQQQHPIKTSTSFLGNRGVLQRQCTTCGNHAVAGGECSECGKKKKWKGLQAKLTIGEPDDVYEREADQLADQVMAMRTPVTPRISPLQIQRFAGHAHDQGMDAPPSISRVLSSSGRPLESTLRTDMEQRFGYDFSTVRIHSGSTAAQSAQDVNAHAYTVGHNIVFSEGGFALGTYEGQRLLAHELTHVVQQSSSTASVQQYKSDSTTNVLRRRVIQGRDTAGSYQFDDSVCQFRYRQDWYFNFPDSINRSRRRQYMQQVGHDVSRVWSNKYRLIPANRECSCFPEGCEVDVLINRHESDRERHHGYTVNVSPTESRGWTHPHTGEIDLRDTHDTPVPREGIPTGQSIPAHEFGHAIGLTDEYVGWARFWDTPGSHDQNAIMYEGEEVRPRHYQPFADMLNVITGGNCNYQPNGERTEYENPAILRTLSPVGLIYDRRAGTQDILGLVTPTYGLLHTKFGGDRIGIQAGVRLNQLTHPLNFGVRVGLTMDPNNPISPPQIPVTVDLGIRTRGGSVGLQYAPIITLSERGVDASHVLGVSGTF